jgi:outer membrane autotransporter protein
MNGWVQGVGAWQRLRSDGNAIGLKQNLGGVVAGFDFNPFAAVAPSLKSGVAFSYVHGDLGGGSETGATDSYRGVIYATQDFGPAYLGGRLGFGVTQMTTTRQITALGLSRTAFGNTSGSDWAAAINAGYRCIEGPYLAGTVDRVGLEPRRS